MNSFRDSKMTKRFFAGVDRERRSACSQHLFGRIGGRLIICAAPCNLESPQLSLMRVPFRTHSCRSIMNRTIVIQLFELHVEQGQSEDQRARRAAHRSVILCSFALAGFPLTVYKATRKLANQPCRRRSTLGVSRDAPGNTAGYGGASESSNCPEITCKVEPVRQKKSRDVGRCIKIPPNCPEIAKTTKLPRVWV